MEKETTGTVTLRSVMTGSIIANYAVSFNDENWQKSITYDGLVGYFFTADFSTCVKFPQSQTIIEYKRHCGFADFFEE